MSRQSVLSQKKKRGPAPTGKGTLIGVRLQPQQLDQLDEFRGRQQEPPSRPEAIRTLITMALNLVSTLEPDPGVPTAVHDFTAPKTKQTERS